MKLKKQVKVVLSFLLLGGIGCGLYSFNHWFFAKYKTKDVKLEEKNEGILIEINESKPQSQEEPIVKESSDSSKVVQKIRPTEVYYCSAGDTLDGNECITKLEMNAMPVILTTKDNTFTMKFDFMSLANVYSVEEKDIIPILEETCKTELKGKFYINLNDEHSGFCTFKEEQKPNAYMCADSSYTLKGNKCAKEVKIPAKIRYECPKDYIVNGIYCQEK